MRGDEAAPAETEAGARLAGALVMFDPDRKRNTAAAKVAAAETAPAPEPVAPQRRCPRRSASRGAADPADAAALEAARTGDHRRCRPSSTRPAARPSARAARPRRRAPRRARHATPRRAHAARPTPPASRWRTRAASSRRRAPRARARGSRPRRRSARSRSSARSCARRARRRPAPPAGWRASSPEAREEAERAKAETERLEGALAEASAEPAELADLREASERFRRAFDRAPVGTVLTAADGRILHVNRALCETLGHSADALLADDPPALIHPDDAEAKHELARRLLAGDQWSARGHRRYVHADGRAITMRESASLVRDADGEPADVHLPARGGARRGRAWTTWSWTPTSRSTRRIRTGARPRRPSPRPPCAARSPRTCSSSTASRCSTSPTNEVRQHELLIRMLGEDGRLYLPEAFLGAARRAGLSHEIDRWVRAPGDRAARPLRAGEARRADRGGPVARGGGRPRAARADRGGARRHPGRPGAT